MIDPRVVETLVDARARQPRLTDRPAHKPRSARCWARWRRAGTTPASRAALGLSERAVEKHINAVFSKLGLSEETDVHRRVKAVLVYLSDSGSPPPMRASAGGYCRVRMMLAPPARCGTHPGPWVPPMGEWSRGR